jgi:shikimate kinase
MGEGKVKAENGSAKALIASKSLVLTGFMGTGKTVIGQIVAQRLGREFVDMDSMIETREGNSIRKIFQTRGEEYFRTREAQLCVELASRENLVIATGGGALIDPSNRERFRNAFVVCLDASTDEISSG